MNRNSVVIMVGALLVMIWIAQNMGAGHGETLLATIDRVFEVSVGLSNTSFLDIEWLLDLWILLGALWLLAALFWLVLALCLSPGGRSFQRYLIIAVILAPLMACGTQLANAGAQSQGEFGGYIELQDLFNKVRNVVR